MGTNHRKCRRYIVELCSNNSGDAVIEATILFPIMTMIFAALVMLSVYLPSQAVLQRATQYAATAIATEISDTWLFYDDSSMSYYRHNNKESLNNVYSSLFITNDVGLKGENIVTNIESRSISSKTGELTVECRENNMFIYKEITVTASREYPIPVDLSFIGFPKTIIVTASSKAVIQNAEEFIRNVDIATDFAAFIGEKFGLNDVGDSISSFGSRVKSILGW